MGRKYENLFKPMKLGKKVCKNRIMQSPIGDMMANPDGTLSEQMLAYYAERAKGGAGIICPAVLCVDYPQGKTVKFQLRIDSDYCINDLAKFSEQVHRYGALLIPQIHHAGAQTFAGNTGGVMPVCVSDKDVDHVFIQPYRMAGPQKELTNEEIYKLIQKFIDAAVYCQKGGCDGVSLHGAHGYLINQFFSRDTNAREDEFGGSLENRCRFAVEIVKGIRKACGPNFIIGARLPGKEWTPNGLTDEECAQIAKLLEDAGCDFFDVSGGSTDIPSRLMETDWYAQGNRVPLGENIKKAVSVPVGVVGVLRDPDFCDKLIADGKVDFVVLGRTLICDPYWPQKAKEGRTEEIRPCLTCSDGCLNQLSADRFISCSLNPAAGREATLSDVGKACESKKVLVIGGGIGGMQAAITAARRGHSVTLWEKDSELGGQMHLAGKPPRKKKIGEAREWFAGELGRLGVNVECSKKASVEAVKAFAPDAVIVATGSTPIDKLPIEGCETAAVADDIILETKGKMPEGKKVVIVGGGTVGCELAEMLTEKKNQVTIIEMLPQIATGMEMLHMADMMGYFMTNGVKWYTSAPAKKITSNSVTFINEGKEETIEADLVILATGRKADNELARQLEAEGIRVIVVGDAKEPRKFLNATLEATYAGIDIA